MEGKKRYVAIVLFLLIGLTLFAFANPIEEQKGSKGNGSKDSEVTDKDTVDGTLGEVGTENQNQPQYQQVVDNTYTNALAAVVKAESSLDEIDVDAARDLVQQVTNQNQKNELTERLDIIEEAIDAIELVETLEKMVEEATEREDIEDSTDYRTDEEIIQKVDALRNEEVQESLLDRLQILSRILDDIDAPTYEGVKDNEITNQNVSLTYSDKDEETDTENEVTVTVTLNGEEIDFAETFTEEGTYVVTLTDEAFNETVVTFTIDKTAAKKNAVNANVNGYKNDVKAQYATNGNTVTAYISINEELKENPTFTFYANGKEIKVIAKEDVVARPSSNAKYPYVYEVKLVIDENLEAEDGELTFTVTDIYDKAGNKTDDITKVSNGKVITLDRTPNRVTFTSIKTTNDAVKGNTYYVRNGDTVTLRIGFREKLGTNAVVKIGGREATLAYVKYFAQPNHHEYTATLTIPADETELAEGELSFTIENVTDEIGNKGFYYQTNGKTVLETITKNVTTNGKKVIYDRTAPARKSADFYVSGLTQVGKTFYTQYDKTVVVNITTDEELAEVPTFTLHNNGNNYAMNDAIYRGLNDKGYHLYQASFEITEESGMTDGNITFTVSNIKDIVGNASADVTEATNGRLVVLDNKAPLVDKLALVGANGEWNKNKTEYKQYAKVGTTIYVNARFYEELATTPVVTLNDTVTLTKATKQQSGNIWIYSYSYKVKADDGLVDGPLQVKVTNCKDYAGNSVELTNANATMTSQKDIIIDKTAPTYALYKEGLRPVQNVEVVEHNGKLYFNDNAEIQFHDNYRLSTMIVNDGKPYTTTVGVTGQIKYVRADGEYKYTVKDRAGNATTITVVRDTVAPEVTEHSYIGEDSVYRGMSFKLFDNSAVDKFVLNGTEYDRSNNNWSDANYDNISSSLKDGENTLVLYDIAGNATEHKFTLDRKGPEIIVKPSSVGIDNIYSKLDLKLFDENEVSYAIINGEEVIRKGTWVDIDDGHAYHAKHGENTIVAVDKAGNTTTKTFNVTKFNLVVENGVANLNEDAILIDKPFYNDIDAENEVTINGNGKTVTQYITSADKMYWVGNHTTPNGANIPVLANVFSTLTGKKFTINNLTLTGTMNSVMFGNYENTDSNWFNTELNNVNIINTKVVSLTSKIAPAAVIYGKATLNNVNIYGTTRSELENAPDDPYWTIYDLAAVNSSNTTINGGKIGSMYLWEKAVMTINNAEVDVIDTKTTTGHLEIGNGTTVNRINMNGTNSFKPDVTIKAGATVKTLDLTKVTNLTDIVIEDGATVETILTAEGEMTLEAWKTANNK